MTCQWWRLVHHPRSPMYNGRHSVLGYECTCPIFCTYNILDEGMGGCVHRGDAEYTRKGQVAPVIRSYAVKPEAER